MSKFVIPAEVFNKIFSIVQAECPAAVCEAEYDNAVEQIEFESLQDAISRGDDVAIKSCADFLVGVLRDTEQCACEDSAAVKSA